MKCTVIDDEPFALELLRDYVRRTPFLEEGECFSNPYKALAYLNNEKPDLIFLDINMPELTGIQLYKSLTSPPLVIFTTAYPEYAAESYEYNAVDYLVKPIKYERFLKAVNKAAGLMASTGITSPSAAIPEKSNHKKEFIMIKSGNRLVKVFPDDIQYIEAAGNYMCFHINGKKLMSLLNMKDVLGILPEDEFVRIHKSYIISLKHLDAVERHDVVIAGRQIPIGITYREHFISKFSD
jgi:two-component system, LytTR family, response regulator